MAMNTAKRNAIVAKSKPSEPITSEETYTRDFLIALNYYNTENNDKDKQKWLVNYVAQTDKKLAAAIAKNSDERDCRHAGIICRILSNGGYIAPKDMDFLRKTIETLSKAKVKEPVVATTPKKNVVSIQERMDEVARTHAAEFDAAIDDFVINKEASFSAKAYLKSNNIAGPIAKRIGESFSRLIAELNEVLLGEDKDLVEGWSNLTKREVKKLLQFVEGMVADCNQQVQSAKTNRAPRRRKEVSPAKLVARFKMMRELPELKLKSVPAANIIGSSEVWYYNQKYKHIGVYKAEAGNTLSVKGTTIIGFDVKESKRLTLRKPEEFFKGLSLGKRALNSAIKTLKTKPATPNGRFNEECILLGAF